MTLRDKLAEWTAAGLLSPPQAEAIAAFEAAAGEKTRLSTSQVPAEQTGIWDAPRGVKIASSVAGVSIALGIIAVVASNWDAIPGALKIAGNFGILALLGWGLVSLGERRVAWAFDAMLLTFVGVVVGSVALVMQQFQLNISFARALPMIFVAVSPALLLGRSRFVAGFWILLACGTWCAVAAEFFPEFLLELIGPQLIFALPFALAALAEWLKRNAPDSPLRQSAVPLSWSLLAIGTSISTFVLYRDVREAYARSGTTTVAVSLVVALALVLGLAAVLHRMLRVEGHDHSATPEDASRGAPQEGRSAALRRLAWVSACVMLLPLVVPWLTGTSASSLLSAVIFVLYWVVVGNAAVRSGWARGTDLVAIVLGIRLLAIYIEVFGSLLSTGLGLIGAGLLTLLLVSVWMRRRQALLAALGPSQQGGPA